MAALGNWTNSFSLFLFFLYVAFVIAYNFGLIAFNWFLGELALGKMTEVNSELAMILILSGTLVASILGTLIYSSGAFLASTNFFR